MSYVIIMYVISSLEDSCNFYRHEYIMPSIAFTALKLFMNQFAVY